MQRPCDVVEEILRIYGYNNIEIPTTVKSSLSVKGEADKSHKLQNLVAEMLVGNGFHEILNNSLQRGAYCEGLDSYRSENSVRLLNPLSNDLNCLRQTLLFGGLESIGRNAAHRMPSQRMFEFGNCYHFDAARKCPDIIPGVSQSRDPEVIKHVLDAYSEEAHMGLWVTGKRVSGSWIHADEDSSFAELKAYVLNVLQRIGIGYGLEVVVGMVGDGEACKYVVDGFELAAVDTASACLVVYHSHSLAPVVLHNVYAVDKTAQGGKEILAAIAHAHLYVLLDRLLKAYQREWCQTEVAIEKLFQIAGDDLDVDELQTIVFRT